MAIICCRLDAEVNFGTSSVTQTLADTHLHSTPEESLPSRTSEEEAQRMGDYRDILSLTRVLMHGPKSKTDVDILTERSVSFLFFPSIRFLKNLNEVYLLAILQYQQYVIRLVIQMVQKGKMMDYSADFYFIISFLDSVERASPVACLIFYFMTFILFEKLLLPTKMAHHCSFKKVNSIH